MKYYCNPVNVPYRYQFNMDPRSNGKLQIDREGADPSMIQFQGKYYIFRLYESECLGIGGYGKLGVIFSSKESSPL